MTPERCLTMLSFASSAFSDVGLLVFDECHLLSPQSGKIRRSLDGMLCVLAFNQIAPGADFLFLSAMLKDGYAFVKWIGSLTGRESVFVDLLWKPSRQARGVIIYQDDELTAAKTNALKVQRSRNAEAGTKAKGLRAVAKKQLLAHPFAIWGLQHNWLSGKQVFCSFQPVAETPMLLTGDMTYGALRLTPNANHVAASLAVSAAKSGLKTIVFVNTKADAASTANEISNQLGEVIEPTASESERWHALEIELGGLKHSLLNGSQGAAVPHNSAMLRLERDLSERLFRRTDGAKVIVATPTLAQGLNLPAQLAILAGDKRANVTGSGREDLEAHEILNAAARAGRAGHLANGAVLLIPEPLLSYTKGKPLRNDVVKKLRSILPEDDRCVTITDPLEVVLDRIMDGQIEDRDVRYTINRMSTLGEVESDGGSKPLFDLGRSFGSFVARERAAEKEFDLKIASLRVEIDKASELGLDDTIIPLVSQSGIPADLLADLKNLLKSKAGSLPTTVPDWVQWIVAWLATNDRARTLLLFDVRTAILASTGEKRDAAISPATLKKLLPGLLGWISGKPLREIELVLGGTPDSDLDTRRICPRARELVGTVIPRGISFIASLVSHLVATLELFDAQETLSRDLVGSLSTAIRRGFDSLVVLQFALNDKATLGRVQAHNEWKKSITFLNLP